MFVVNNTTQCFRGYYVWLLYVVIMCGTQNYFLQHIPHTTMACATIMSFAGERVEENPNEVCVTIVTTVTIVTIQWGTWCRSCVHIRGLVPRPTISTSTACTHDYGGIVVSKRDPTHISSTGHRNVTLALKCIWANYKFSVV